MIPWTEIGATPPHPSLLQPALVLGLGAVRFMGEVLLSMPGGHLV